MAEVKALIAGYRGFYEKYFASDFSLYKKLQQVGQSPKTLIIACSDSRVDPSIITNAEPGDIFVIRNVANLVPPYETRETGLHGVSAALEFAVCVLGVKHIVVMGHSHCAGIQTLMTPEKLGNSDFIGQWVNVAEPAREKTLANHPHADAEALCHHCEQESVLLSLQNLLTFPWVKSRADAGDLKLHGWYFSLETGKLEGYDPAKSQFVTL